jgi:lysophospholipase L1-like esterase
MSIRSTAVNAALAVGSVLLLFVLGETALRVYYAIESSRYGGLRERLERSKETDYVDRGEVNMTGLVQPSRYQDIVYELKPGISGLFRGKPFRISSAGLRDSEYSRVKPPGTFRIAGLGDSVMFGWGVGQDDPYLEVLERRLNDLPGDPRSFEVLNFAVPGYNTAMEVSVFEHKALVYDPDLVVIQFVNNDTGVPIFMQKPKSKFSLKRLYVVDFISSYLSKLENAEGQRLFTHRLRNVEGEAEKDEILSQYSYMLGVKGFRRAMARLAELTEERGIPVIVITGTLSKKQKNMVREAATEHGFHVLPIGPYSDAWVKDHGIPDNRKARQKALWVSRGDHHPNADAHTIYADGLMDVMRETGIISY